MGPCVGCHAGCCRSFAVPVTGADILRIERGLGLSFWDFVCRWADPNGAIAGKYAPHFFFDDEPGTPFVVALTHQESHNLPGTTKCRFLVEGQPDSEHPLGEARCGIYHFRPAACRVFPTKFNETGELAVIHEVPSHTRGDGDSAYQLCPRQWTPDDFDPIQPLHDLIVARYEMQLFQQLAVLWNKEPRPWPLFPQFLHMVYEKRVVCEQPEEPQVIPFPAPRPASKAA